MLSIIYSGDMNVAFLGAIIKWVDISLPPQWATRSTTSLKLWVYVQFFIIMEHIRWKNDLITNPLLSVFVIFDARLDLQASFQTFVTQLHISK